MQAPESTFLGSLPKDVTEKIVSRANLIKYDDGQLIHSRGEHKPGLSIVAKGAVHIGVYDINGKFSLAAILGLGETFGEFALFTELERTHDVYAAKDTQVYQLSASSFMQLYESEIEISQALLKVTLTRTHLLLDILDAIRRLPIDKRAAKILLTMSQVSEDPNLIKYRQTELAYTLGVSRVSAGKALKTLCSEDLIELGYREIKIPSLKRLAHWLGDE